MKTLLADDKPPFDEGPAGIDESAWNRWEDDGGFVPPTDDSCVDRPPTTTGSR